MNWQSLISGELPDSDLWLLSVFDRFSESAQEKRWHHAEGCRGRLFMPSVAIPLSLPAAGIALTPRLLPVPIAIRRG